MCATQDAIVILDVRQDRYFALSLEKAHTLSSIVQGWPVTAESPDQDAVHLAHRLEQQDLLTRDQQFAQPEDPFRSKSSPADLWMLEEPSQSPRIRPIHFIKFAAACLGTKWRLRGRSLSAALNRMEENKKRLGDVRVSLDEIAERVSVFRRLRVFAFAANGHCLYHALALCEFLASYKIPAELTIGVRTHPWAAHSWVQYGNALLDSKPEHVHAYTVIHQA